MVSGFATLLPGAEGDDEGPDAGEEEGRRVGAKGRVCVGGAGGKGRGVWGYEAKGGDVCGGVWGVGKGGEGGRSTRLCLPHEHTRPVCMMHRRGRPVSAAAPCWLSHSQPPPSLKLPPFDPVGYPPRPLILPPPPPTHKDDEDESKGGAELDEEAWRKMQSFEARSIDPQTLQEVRRGGAEPLNE